MGDNELVEIREILSVYGINSAETIEQIYKSAWNINNKYILKCNSDHKQIEKSIYLSDLLIKENISVPEYLRTLDGKYFVKANDTFYVLMKKINGGHLNPYKGDPYANGVMLGRLIANLHLALKNIGDSFECYDADYMKELDEYIIKNIKEKDVQVPQKIIDYCYSFGSLYKTLPRQLIHRDVHCGNILFVDKSFSGYLDFDLCQKNVRLHDICYLGASLLVGKYQDENHFKTWCDIFRGVLYGYKEIFELTVNEIDAIPYMFVFIELTFTAFFAQVGQMETSISCANMTEWFYLNRDRIANIVRKD